MYLWLRNGAPQFITEPALVMTTPSAPVISQFAELLCPLVTLARSFLDAGDVGPDDRAKIY